MNFNDKMTNKNERFSIGKEEDSGRYYLSIPVSNQYVDYEEYYEIDRSLFESFMRDSSSAIEFAELCRERKKDSLLIIQPGSDRGRPQ